MTEQFHGPYWIDPDDQDYRFPAVELALREPDGLLAVGGDLSPNRLLQAYQSGIFPWYSEGQPILWWCPDPRTVLFQRDLYISRSLRRGISKHSYQITMDTAFSEVIKRCSEPRASDSGTWITGSMLEAYQRLHEKGAAHSVEYWQDGALKGGLYGVAIGRMFFGESMFSLVRDASKIVLIYLSEQLQAWGFPFIDCQIYSEHLGTLGATRISRQEFTDYLHRYCDAQPSGQTLREGGKWCFDRKLLEEIRPSGKTD